MTTIDPSTPLAALIRAQFDAQLRGAPSHGKPVAAAKIAREKEKVSARTAHEMVALRVRAIPPDDPERRRKACKLFMTAVLMQAFGRRRLDDQGFDQLVEAVMMRMEADPGLRASLDDAADRLIADASR